MAVTRLAGTWTYDDLLSLPDEGRRYKIIEGDLYEVPAPSWIHVTVVMNLILLLGPLVRSLEGTLATAPVDAFHLGADPVQPDIFAIFPGSRASGGGRSVHDRSLGRTRRSSRLTAQVELFGGYLAVDRRAGELSWAECFAAQERRCGREAADPGGAGDLLAENSDAKGRAEAVVARTPAPARCLLPVRRFADWEFPRPLSPWPAVG